MYLLIHGIDCAVIAVDAKDHMHRRQLLAGMIVSDTRSVSAFYTASDPGCSCKLRL